MEAKLATPPVSFQVVVELTDCKYHPLTDNPMKSDQAQLVLSARVKLLKRQLLEWKTLLINQRKVRDFAYESTAKTPIRFYNAVNTSADLVIRQSMRLSDLMDVHKEELDGMRARHQQEDATLEQVIKTMKEKSS